MAADSGQAKGDRVTLPTRKRRSGVHLTTTERKRAKAAFLKAFSASANVRDACRRAHISRNTLYEWLEKDEPFSILYHQAGLDANDALLDAAWKRAVKGVETLKLSGGHPVYVDGKLVKEREYSDTVLLRLMSWRIPGFRERSGDINVNILPKEYVGFDPSREGSES